MDTWMGAMPASPMTAGFQDVQGQVMELVKENAEAAFTLAGKSPSNKFMRFGRAFSA
jgi:hypothetical protein